MNFWKNIYFESLMKQIQLIKNLVDAYGYPGAPWTHIFRRTRVFQEHPFLRCQFPLMATGGPSTA